MKNVIPIPDTPEFQLVLQELRNLNQTYGLTVSLVISPSTRGFYNVRRDQIVLGLSGIGRDSSLMTFVHEYAHALNRSRNGKNHDMSFYRSLREVARFVLGAEDRYEWYYEYVKVQKMAKLDGLLKAAPLEPPKPPKMFANRMGCLEFENSWLSDPCGGCQESTCLRFQKD